MTKMKRASREPLIETVEPAKRFKAGIKVTITGDVWGGVSGKLAPIPDGEVATVFEDYGQTRIGVMRDNGQLRTVARGACTCTEVAR